MALWHYVWNNCASIKAICMKKMIIGLAIVITSGMAVPASAQVRVNLNINIGSQPAWGPAGYDYVEYYYLPDIDVYYYVPTAVVTGSLYTPSRRGTVITTSSAVIKW